MNLRLVKGSCADLAYTDADAVAILTLLTDVLGKNPVSE